MKVLVTGAAGFIGSHLVEALVDIGDEVVALDRPEKNCRLIENMGATIISADIRDLRQVVCAAGTVQAVYHLAAIPNWQGAVSRADYRSINVDGTRTVLEACRLNGIGRVVFASSLEAVGPSLDGKAVTEATDPHPNNIYGETKYAAEKLMRTYYEKYGIETIRVRLPAVYGPRNDLHLERYFKMARRGLYPLIANGQALMEFCYVKNAVHGLILAMQRAPAGEVYFISDDSSYEFKKVIDTIGQELDVHVHFVPLPVSVAYGLGWCIEYMSKFIKCYPFIFKGTGRPAFSRRSVVWLNESRLFCDISKAKRELGYQAPYSLREGIRENVQWYRAIGAL